MTIIDPRRASSTSPVMGWCDDPQSVVRQATHAVEAGRLVALCGVRVEYTGEDWSEFTRFARCAICRLAADIDAS